MRRMGCEGKTPGRFTSLNLEVSPMHMYLRLLFAVFVTAISGSAFAADPTDRTQALSELSQIFFEDSETYGRELLDRRKLDYSVESLKLIDEYLESIRKRKDVEATWNRTVLRAGAYVGEVIRRNDKKVQWRWVDYDGARSVEPEMFDSFGKSIATAAVLYDGNNGFSFPLAKVEKYLNNGSEDSVYFFAKVIMSGRE